MRNKSRVSKKGYCHSPGCSLPQFATRIARRRREEKFVPQHNEIPSHRSSTSLVYRKLAGIILKLGPLSEQRGLLRFLKNVDHANTLNEFVQDLDYAVVDYQVCVANLAQWVVRCVGQTSTHQTIHETTKSIDKNARKIDEATKEIGEATKKIDENIRNVIVSLSCRTGPGGVEIKLSPGSRRP